MPFSLLLTRGSSGALGPERQAHTQTNHAMMNHLDHISMETKLHND